MKITPLLRYSDHYNLA